jgi:hypothetical protein
VFRFEAEAVAERAVGGNQRRRNGSGEETEQPHAGY